MIATTSLQVVKTVGAVVFYHVTDFGRNWRIETVVQIMAW